MPRDPVAVAGVFQSRARRHGCVSLALLFRLFSDRRRDSPSFADRVLGILRRPTEAPYAACPKLLVRARVLDAARTCPGLDLAKDSRTADRPDRPVFCTTMIPRLCPDFVTAAIDDASGNMLCNRRDLYRDNEVRVFRKVAIAGHQP